MSAYAARWLGLVLMLSVLLGTLSSSAQDTIALRRFALVVAANDGGPTRPRLKHALADANAVSKVLLELGGVSADDALQLVEPTVDELRRAIIDMQARTARLKNDKSRTELLFYYSGHSDEQGILLGRSQLGYKALRALLDSVQAHVRVAILDSCASGSFTREKGGARRAPFLFDSSSAVSGHAFLSSASEHEAAQESDRLGGSFFTHYLVSGLRGAADKSGDRKVTLTEAYQFAFDETLARTGQTQIGAQHPAYDIRLVGTGDLVLTDLRSTASELVIAPEVEGQLFVRDTGGALFLELNKQRGRTTRIALPASRYTLELRNAGKLYRTNLTTHAGEAARTVSLEQLSEVPGEASLARGDPYLRVHTAGAIVAKVGTNMRWPGRRIENQLDFALFFDRPDALSGVQLSLGAGMVKERARGLQLASLFTSADQLNGVQLSFVLNYVASQGSGVALGAFNGAGGEFHGLQLGAANGAKRLQGVQLSAFNLAGELKGVQLGLLNVSSGRVHGLQLGLLNYADEADVAFGALSLTRQGGVHAVLASSDVALLSFGLRLDAKYNYNFVAAGYHPLGGLHEGYSLGLGFGAKIPVLRTLLWLDVELGWHVVQGAGGWAHGVPNTLSQLRLLLRLELAKQLSFFVGPSFNVLLQLDPAERVRLGFVMHTRTIQIDDDVRVLYWPGVAGGVQF